MCSVDGSFITAFLVQECEGSSRIGSRPRRYLFTGHSNGSLQMWDLTTAMEMRDHPPGARAGLGKGDNLGGTTRGSAVGVDRLAPPQEGVPTALCCLLCCFWVLGKL